jgi:hypothetical protein
VFVLRLARPSQVSFGGAVKGESAMKSEDDIGTLVEYEFRVSSLICGSKYYCSLVIIEIPYA